MKWFWGKSNALSRLVALLVLGAAVSCSGGGSGSGGSPDDNPVPVRKKVHVNKNQNTGIAIDILTASGKIEAGHSNQFKIALTSDETQVVKDVRVNLYLFYPDGAEGDIPEQHFLGETTIAEVYPGTQTYILTLDVPALFEVQYPLYKVFGHVFWGDEATIMGLEAEDPADSVALESRLYAEVNGFSEDEVAEIKASFEEELANSVEDANVDIDARSYPDIELKNFSLQKAANDPGSKVVLVVFEDHLGASGSTDDDDPTLLSGSARLYLHGCDVSDVKIEYVLGYYNGGMKVACTSPLLVLNSGTGTYVPSLNLGSTVAYTSIVLTPTFRISEDLFNEIKSQVQWDEQPRNFYVEAKVSLPSGEEVKYADNNSKIADFTLIPDKTIIIETVDDYKYDMKRQWKKDIGMGGFGIGIDTGTHLYFESHKSGSAENSLINTGAEAWGKVPFELPGLSALLPDSAKYVVNLEAHTRVNNYSKIESAKAVLDVKDKISAGVEMTSFGGKVFSYNLAKNESKYPPAVDLYAELGAYETQARYNVSIPGHTIWSWEQTFLTYNQFFMAGPVPITVGMSLWGGLGLNVILSYEARVFASAIPWATVGVSAYGAVGLPWAQAGVGTDLWLLTAYARGSLWYDPELTYVTSPNRIMMKNEFGEQLDMQLEGPKGTFYLFARIKWLKFRKGPFGVPIPCGFEWKQEDFTLAKWGPAFELKKTIYYNKQISNVKLAEW